MSEMEKTGMKRPPLAVRRLETIVGAGIGGGFCAGVSAAIPYLFTSESALRVAIYSVTGKIFWSNFYILFFFAVGAVVSFLLLELSVKGKASLYLQRDKVALLRQLYLDPAISNRSRFLITSFLTITVLFFTSFGLQMGLGVLKSFILR